MVLRPRFALLGALLGVLAGCAGPGAFAPTRPAAEAWAASRGFLSAPAGTPAFPLFTLLRRPAAAPVLTIYIEGDGAPWASPYHPPRDPTPLRPLVLLLAAADPAPAVAYLARPCQYLPATTTGDCAPTYWTDRRFAPEVLAAVDRAVTQLKAAAGARRVRLIGFSGGGVIATLLALRRDDVESLVTVASPLALTAWARSQDLTPLSAPDPLSDSPHRSVPPAVHFAGANDGVVPVPIIRRFVDARGGRLEVVGGFDHDCCWARDWPQLLRRTPATEDLP